MSCSSCNGKGYQESSIMRDAKDYPMMIKCPSPTCKYTDKYYDMIRQQYSDKPVSEVVIPKPNLSLDDFIGARKSSDIEDTIDIHIPQQVVDAGPDKVQEYITAYIDKHNKLNPRPTVPNQDQGNPEPSQVSHNGPRSEVEMDTTYTNLPKAMVDVAEQIMKENPQAGIVLQTPFGPLATRSLVEANRIMGTIKSYWNAEEELAIADETENVIIFPLGKSLGFEE